MSFEVDRIDKGTLGLTCARLRMESMLLRLDACRRRGSERYDTSKSKADKLFSAIVYTLTSLNREGTDSSVFASLRLG